MTSTADILRINAYGARWHVMVEGRGVVFSASTKRACIAYCQRHEIDWRRSVERAA